MKKPLIIERFADNGEFSHYELIDSETGDMLWTEDQENQFSTIKIAGFMIKSDANSLKVSHLSNNMGIRIAPKSDNSCIIYAE